MLLSAGAPIRRASITRVWHRLAELIGVAQGRRRGKPAPRPCARSAWRGAAWASAATAPSDSQRAPCVQPLAKVLDQFDQGLRLGCKDFEVVAGDLGSYGQDLGSNIVDLLAGLMERSPAFRLPCRTSTQVPRPLPRAAREPARRERVSIASIIIPVQSGSDHVLARMRRGHTAAEAQAAVAAVRAACPTAALDNHVLIGFPGETDVDFQETLKLLQACQFDNVTCYNYEDRPNTEASEMRPKVPRRTMKARGFRLKREIEGLRSAVRYFADEHGAALAAARLGVPAGARSAARTCTLSVRQATKHTGGPNAASPPRRRRRRRAHLRVRLARLASLLLQPAQRPRRPVHQRRHRPRRPRVRPRGPERLPRLRLLRVRAHADQRRVPAASLLAPAARARRAARRAARRPDL